MNHSEHWIAVGLDIWSVARYLMPIALSFVTAWKYEPPGVSYSMNLKDYLWLICFFGCVLAISGKWA